MRGRSGSGGASVGTNHQEERRLDAAQDEAAEEVAHQRLAALVRQRQSLEAELEQARARVSAHPVEQMRRRNVMQEPPARDCGGIGRAGSSTPGPAATGYRQAALVRLLVLGFLDLHVAGGEAEEAIFIGSALLPAPQINSAR
jgi:hypothetical protein